MQRKNSVYNAFDRALYAEVVKDVRAHDPAVRLRDAWVYKLDKDHWEFHYKEFYWHGDASSAFEARANGWSRWLDRQSTEVYDAT